MFVPVHASKKGFISAIFLVIVGLLTLQFVFDIDVLAILQSSYLRTISDFVIKYTLIAWHGLVSLYQFVTT